MSGPKVLNKKHGDRKPKTQGIPCPKCGGRDWRFYSIRHLGSKTFRVRVCPCGQRIRTVEVLHSPNSPPKFKRDAKRGRKVADAKPAA